MSGGYFDYQQYRIFDLAESVKELINSNQDTTINQWGEQRGRQFSPEVIEQFKKAHHALQVAYVYAQRIDWLVSDDDGQEQFLSRLVKDMSDLDK